jgi:hypothetical protein
MVTFQGLKTMKPMNLKRGKAKQARQVTGFALTLAMKRFFARAMMQGLMSCLAIVLNLLLR